ncbi:MAG: hypothetical protein GY803_17735 [Chloroflexi bacterium]|nr:hypothetical protein [Chloroflexota bacterium]
MTTAPTASSFTDLGRQFLHQNSTFFTRPFEIFRNYKKEDFRPDLIAGLTVAVAMLPQAIAYKSTTKEMFAASLAPSLPPCFFALIPLPHFNANRNIE